MTKLSKLQNILLHIEEIRNFLLLIRRCFYYHLFFSLSLLFLSCILFSFNAHHINLVLNLMLFIMNSTTEYENLFCENFSPTHCFFTVFSCHEKYHKSFMILHLKLIFLQNRLHSSLSYTLRETGQNIEAYNSVLTS